MSTPQTRRRLFRREAGLPPGSLVPPPQRDVQPTTYDVIDYGAKDHEVFSPDALEACRPLLSTASVTWLNVVGLADIPLIRNIGEVFNVHPLALEDIVNTGQRAKIEEFGENIFIVVTMLHYDEELMTLMLQEHVR